MSFVLQLYAAKIKWYYRSMSPVLGYSVIIQKICPKPSQQYPHTQLRKVMDERHTNLDRYFDEQRYTLENFILPLIELHQPLTTNTKVLEVGCGYGGNLIPFLEKGCQVTGIDIHEPSIAFAQKKLARYPLKQVNLIAADFRTIKGYEKSFDVIFMKDTLEHIPGHGKLMQSLQRFLKDDGVIFQGFPPWRNPFGGHQQMCKNRLLSRLPWFHLAPRSVFKQILKVFGEEPDKIQAFLTDVYDTRISIQQFKNVVKKETDLCVLKEQLYLVNPNYQVKFGLKPRQLGQLFNIPHLRDFYTTTAYYLLGRSSIHSKK